MGLHDIFKYGNQYIMFDEFVVMEWLFQHWW